MHAFICYTYHWRDHVSLIMHKDIKMYPTFNLQFIHMQYTIFPISQKVNFRPFIWRLKWQWANLWKIAFIIIWTPVESFISRWALNTSQWQLYRDIVCFWADLWHSCRMWRRTSDWSSKQHIYEYIHFSGYSAAWLLQGWCHVKCCISAHILCTPYNIHSLYTIGTIILY